MKWISICLLCLLAFSRPVYAQECSEAVLLEMPGKWTEGMKGSTSGTTAADLAREKTFVAAIHKMLQLRYKPLGSDADYNGIYSADNNRPANAFGYALRVMPYGCNGNAVKKAHETNTSLSIMANEITFGPEIFQPFIEASAWDLGFRAMRKMPVEKKEGYFFVEETSLGFGLKGTQYAWLITYDGKLPFLYVTKKEFLEKKKAKLTAGQQAESESIKSNYQTRPKAEQEKMLQKAMKGFDDALAKVNEFLKLPADELNQPAIVKQDTHDFLSHLFTTDADPFANVLIKPNPAYFNKRLPRSSPQFISVMLRGYEKNPVLGQAMKSIEQAIDFNALKAMVGK